MNQNTLITVGIIAILIIGGGISYFTYIDESGGVTPGTYDEFATCLKDSGALFYGAFWCPHCQNQKKAFGSSQKLLPYVECSTPDGQGQLQICKDEEIKSYPTWKFADGTVANGVLSHDELSEKTGCVLPGGVIESVTSTGGEGETSPAL